MDCTIILKAPQNNSISLFFNSFDVESHSACNYDYLEVRNPGWARSQHTRTQLFPRWCRHMRTHKH